MTVRLCAPRCLHRAPAVTLLVACVLALSAPAFAEAAEPRPFHCDGTDPALFEEIRESGWVGYGETWDLNTCDQGAEIYFEGTTSQWKAWRLQRPVTKKTPEVQFYATLFPFVAFGVLGSIFGIAWVAAAITRRRRIPKVLLSCPSCSVEMPVPLDDPAFRSMFCPACGGACVVVDQAEDGSTRARVRAL